MTEVRVKIEGLEKLQRRFGASGPIVGEEISRAMKASVVYLEGKVKPLTPVNVGRLRSSITHAVEKGPGGRTVGMVGSNVVYAPFVELGTKPHWPPFTPISYWVQRKLGVPPAAKEHYAVVRGVQAAIARRGTKAVEMFQKGFEDAKGFIEKQFEGAMDRILGRLAK